MYQKWYAVPKYKAISICFWGILSNAQSDTRYFDGECDVYSEEDKEIISFCVYINIMQSKITHPGCSELSHSARSLKQEGVQKVFTKLEQPTYNSITFFHAQKTGSNFVVLVDCTEDGFRKSATLRLPPTFPMVLCKLLVDSVTK